MLGHYVKMFPEFVEILLGFGFKISDTDEYFSACFRHFEPFPECQGIGDYGE